MFREAYAQFPILSMRLGKWFYLPFYWYRKAFYQKVRFQFKAKTYENFWHPYNTTWRNERSVEIPVILDFLAQYSPTSTLEIGNVLSHYIKTPHMVVDKYEKRKKVIALDIVDYHPERKFDLIISISTIEHIGWDESPPQKGKHLKAIKQIRSLLNQRGLLIITAPLGHNTDLDNDLFSRKLGFDEYIFYKRTEPEKWVEVSPEKAKNAKYNDPFRGASAFWFGIYRNQ